MHLILLGTRTFIEISLRRAEVYEIWFKKNCIDLFFLRKESIPSGKQELSILDREKYWGSHFLRDNEEVRSLNYPHLSDTEKEHYESSWRFIVKMILDKNRYIDWDLLHLLRTPLDSFYKELNNNLLKYFNKDEVPQCYL